MLSPEEVRWLQAALVDLLPYRHTLFLIDLVRAADGSLQVVEEGRDRHGAESAVTLLSASTMLITTEQVPHFVIG